MQATKNPKTVSALVLQGGGARGAYEYGALKALYEHANYRPDIICGVSIGAISAATIGGAKDHAMDQLEVLWERLSNDPAPFLTPKQRRQASYLFNSGMYYPNVPAMMNPKAATSFYYLSPLYRTLNTVVDFDALNRDSAPEVIISATNINSGQAEYFTNRNNSKIVDNHIVASASLPPNFPMTAIGSDKYWDGGLFANTPMKPAIKALANYGNEYRKELVVIELFPQRGEIPTDFGEVMERMMSLFMQSKFDYDHKLTQRASGLSEFASLLQQDLPPDCEARQHPEFARLCGYQTIDNVVRIRYNNDETFMGIADFTHKTIKQRIQCGFEDGLKQVENLL